MPWMIKSRSVMNRGSDSLQVCDDMTCHGKRQEARVYRGIWRRWECGLRKVAGLGKKQAKRRARIHSRDTSVQ
jgi:hypothetical protein